MRSPVATPEICEALEGVVFREDREHAHSGLVASGVRRRKWHATAETDAAIREAYRLLIQENDRQALKRCAVATGWPRHAVKVRAAALGLARVKEPNWAIGEVAILREFGHLGIEAIQKKLRAAGFERAKYGILLKRKRMQLTANHLGYSATSLAELMGIDAHAVIRWIDAGCLAAERRNTERTPEQRGDIRFITRADVKAFIFAHPEEIDLRKVEKWWFLDVVTDGAITR